MSDPIIIPVAPQALSVRILSDAQAMSAGINPAIYKGEQGERGEKGEKGDTGERGPQGEKGDIGERGEKGDQGEQGPTGDKGDTGDTGADFHLRGIYPTLPDLQSAHPTGMVGDAYAIGTPESNTIYIWSPDTSSWVDVGPLQGPPGTQGPPGATPVRGTDYWTPDDVSAIETYVRNYVDTEILGGEW